MTVPNPIMSRAWAMPSGDTFSIKPIAELLDRYLAGAKVIVDPFARNATRGTITNDLNPTTSAQRHLHAEEFAIALAAENVVADVVLFDPPYTLRQIKECYEGVGRGFTQYDSQDGGRWTKLKDTLSTLVPVGGVTISFGHDSRGFGKKHGFEIVEILLVCHGGAHNDTIVTVERKL